jgi:hypothetical protein
VSCLVLTLSSTICFLRISSRFHLLYLIKISQSRIFILKPRMRFAIYAAFGLVWIDYYICGPVNAQDCQECHICVKAGGGQSCAPSPCADSCAGINVCIDCVVLWKGGAKCSDGRCNALDIPPPGPKPRASCKKCPICRR